MPVPSIGPAPMPFRIFIVEDHPAMRQAYASVIGREPDLELCGVAETAEDALERLAGLSCDLVVTDLRLPGLSGIELVERLHETQPDMQALVISAHEGASFERDAVRAGAAAFLEKRSLTETLLPTVRRVLAA